MATMYDGTQPITVVPIGYVTTNYTSSSETPTQGSENADAIGRIIVFDEFLDGLLGLENYPYWWLLTWLHLQPPQGPPPLRLVPRAREAAGRIQGVYASRSPHRPNPIGLSLVRRVAVAGNVVTFAGVDLIDGTPVLDIKPWFADCDLPLTHDEPE